MFFQDPTEMSLNYKKGECEEHLRARKRGTYWEAPKKEKKLERAGIDWRAEVEKVRPNAWQSLIYLKGS